MTPTEKIIHDFLLNEIVYNRQLHQLGVDDPLLEGLLDSVAIMQVVTFCEEAFNITIPGEELLPDHFTTISAIARFIEQRVAQG